MRAVGALLLLAALAAAQEEDLQAERFERALALAEQKLQTAPKDSRLLELRAKAIRGIARNLQRDRGYSAALRYLEPRLDHWLLAEVYGETCFWAGEERRGLDVLRASSLPVTDRIRPELFLLAKLMRFDEVERRAGEVAATVSWKELTGWQENAGLQAALRKRLKERTRRAARVAWVSLATLLAACATLWKLSSSTVPE